MFQEEVPFLGYAVYLEVVLSLTPFMGPPCLDLLSLILFMKSFKV